MAMCVSNSCCDVVLMFEQVRVGVETYGGGLWHTWLDRDLGLAGRVVVANSDGYSYSHHLVHIAKPLVSQLTALAALLTLPSGA